ncbi:carbohydrate ABC transporter permease [Paramicrobacterium agarici]|uniref:Carbohydrate ABC transporter membrane protein 2 (CUT1 family) n=1 Tax=Paramicrobacterium agarici TaxID=630514 RepID=A0A2A9DZW1_9MICO|nr:carbohydrate ABC transporter permease [Microbacterium agarici]PFG31871.1 carbohydrate ABC transporter membrane protein 2 (CUT1 family) [Microbacterium agarici]TQO21767.1 carbohydrate ABC transporter membrane protein 2 (CUT1 family) [Microbacterium agarici]
MAATSTAVNTTTSVVRRRPSMFRSVQRTLQYVLITLLALFCLIPFAWLVLTAFDADAGSTIKLPDLTASNFVRFFTEANTPRLLANSLIISVLATALNLAVGVLGAYALSRFRFRGRATFMFSILLIRVIPAPATIVALYLLMVKVNLDNTLFGLILVEAAAALPITLWMLKGAIDAVPVEIEEAAWLDGNSRFQGIIRVVAPLVMPGLGATAMLTFMAVWGDFLTPLVLLQSPDLYPLSIGLFRAFSAFNQVDWGLLAASAMIYMIPPAILYMVLRKHLLRSSMGGAIKG